MKKQLIICTDMEGASGIFEENYKAAIHGKEEWRNEGRDYMTSDVLAVCDAANEFGIDEILIYDGHFAGNPEHNIIIEKLPSNVKFFDTPDRCFWWRRIRGQAEWEPYGIITVGQHARYSEENAYFPHTIQSPPIKELTLNGIHIAEIGTAVLNFQGVKYIANIGCQASMKEAKELSKTVYTIPVKDKAKGWQPSIKETYPIIKKGVLEALKNRDNMMAVNIEEPYEFSMTLLEGFNYDIPERISWKGNFNKNKAFWEAPSVEIGLEIFNYVREYIVKAENKDIMSLIGKCGFYCGSCPDYIQGDCTGCRTAHKKGDCYTFDCVDTQQIEFCGTCSKFPCNEIMTRDKATVLDSRWLQWKATKKMLME